MAIERILLRSINAMHVTIIHSIKRYRWVGGCVMMIDWNDCSNSTLFQQSLYLLIESARFDLSIDSDAIASNRR